MNPPLISLIVPVYNTAPYLRQCLDSLLAQTLRDIEVICVNDGSSDDSPHILDEYAKRDARIRVIHQVNQGASAARNTGLALARAPYTGFVDADDWVEKETFETALQQMLANEDVDLVCWGCTAWAGKDNAWIIDKKETPFNHKRFNGLTGRQTLTDELKCALLGPVWDKLFRTDKIKQYDIRFPDEIGIHEDTVFASKYFAWSQHAFFLDSYGYNHRYTPDSILDNAFKKRKGADAVFVPVFTDIYDYYKRFALIEQNRHLLAKILVIVLRHALRFSTDYNAFLVEARQFVRQYDHLPDTETHTIRDLIAGKSFVRFYPLSPLEKILSLTNVEDKKIIRILGLEFAIKRRSSGKKK